MPHCSPALPLGPRLGKVAAALLALALTHPVQAQATLTVDPTGQGGAFTTVQAAILAASPGDRIQVLGAGPYQGFLLDRPVDIQAAGGTRITNIEVTGLLAGQSARIAGFAIDQQGNGDVYVHHCAGTVLLQSVTISGSLSPVLVPGSPGLRVVAAQSVLTRDCTFFGRSGPTGAPAVIVDGSTLAMSGGLAIGGTTIQTPPLQNLGQPGILVVNGSVLQMTSSDAIGGVWSTQPANSCSGGDGLQVVQGIAYVLEDSSLRGRLGAGGGSTGAASTGLVHYTTDCIVNGQMPGAILVEARPRLLAPSQVAIGSTLTIGFDGVPLQFLMLGMDLQGQLLEVPFLGGVLTLTPTAALSGAILLDNNGGGSLSLAIPNVPSAANLTIFTQGLALGFSGHLLTGSVVTRVN